MITIFLKNGSISLILVSWHFDFPQYFFPHSPTFMVVVIPTTPTNMMLKYFNCKLNSRRLICRHVKCTEAFLLNPCTYQEVWYWNALFSEIYTNRRAVYMTAQVTTYSSVLKVSDNSANMQKRKPQNFTHQSIFKVERTFFLSHQQDPSFFTGN